MSKLLPTVEKYNHRAQIPFLFVSHAGVHVIEYGTSTNTN